MNIKDIISDNTQATAPIFNALYYSSIYKKTEKIVCAVFTITDISGEQENVKDIIRDTRASAKESLMAVVALVSAPQEMVRVYHYEGLRGLVILRSMLFVLASAHVIGSDFAEVIVREIDGVIQSIHALFRDLKNTTLVSVIEQEPEYTQAVQKYRAQSRTPRRVEKVRRGSGSNEGGVDTASVSQAIDTRREQIMSIIRTQGIVSIKDISDTIKDYSEKTIQRELIEMIKDSVVAKEGERRWSKYRAV